METIIKAAVERGASDVHIKAGDVFRARIDGELKPLTKQRLTPEQTKAIALQLIPSEADRDRIEQIRDYDCSWGAPGVGRFRVNILRQRSSFMIVMRVIPFEVPTLERLGLPERLGELVEHDRGLVLVSGGGGSGKSSTMAALVHHINATAGKHIVTIESPIEFLHRDLNASVTQREVGVDTDSFASGLRAALRQDPDVILIGELHDAQTFNTALSAGETGQLVIASLPTPDPVTTIERAVSLASTEEQDVMRARLAGVVHAIISQRLLPRADGEGRCAVCEVLVNVEDMPDRIRDGSRSAEIHDGIAKGSAVGMQTFEQHVAELVSEGVLSVETARAVTGVG